MPFRTMVLEPEAVGALTASFEEAWRIVETRGAVDPLRAAAQRERLAYIIVGLWKADPHTVLAEQAVEQFFSEDRLLSAPFGQVAPQDS